jgi:homoserine kinase
MNWPAEAVTVRVPATSANLGPGFDALGLALGRHDEVAVWVTPGGLAIDVSGEGAHTVSAGEDHLVVRAIRAAFEAAGRQPPGLRLRCVNRIPHGRGLGSSAAAIVAGVVAANSLLTRGGAPGLADGELYALAAGIEGHPDNVAACLAGGLTIAWQEDGGPRLIRSCASRRTRSPPRRPGRRCRIPSATPTRPRMPGAAHCLSRRLPRTPASCLPRPRTCCTSLTVRPQCRPQQASSAACAVRGYLR